jgi:hypothetical protein
MKKNEKFLAWGVFGGTLVGIVTDNLGLWISLGLVIGAGVMEYLKKKNDRGAKK